MRIYLDVCCIQRPLDDRAQARIAAEAEAVLGIVAACDAGRLELVSSVPILHESRRAPDAARREYSDELLARAGSLVRITRGVRHRARSLVAAGLKPLDALHLACATEAGSDVFCTCDDQLIRRAGRVHVPPPRIATPVELITELGP